MEAKSNKQDLQIGITNRDQYPTLNTIESRFLPRRCLSTYCVTNVDNDRSLWVRRNIFPESVFWRAFLL